MRVFAILIALSLFSPNVSFASDSAEYLGFQNNVDGNKTLENLPPEIFYNIAEYLNPQDIAQMLLVSKNLHEVFIPILFRYLQNNELKLDLSNRADLQLLIYINSISQGRVPYLKIRTALINDEDVFNLQFYGQYIAELSSTKISNPKFLNTIFKSDLRSNLRALNLSRLDDNIYMKLPYLNELLESLPNDLPLTSLNLSKNKLIINTGEADIFAEQLLSKLPNLEVLKLCNCLFSSNDKFIPSYQIMIRAIANLHKLKILDMGKNHKILSIVLVNTENIIFSTLESLNLSFNGYHDDDVSEITQISSKFPKLNLLNLTGNTLNETSKTAIQNAYLNVKIIF